MDLINNFSMLNNWWWIVISIFCLAIGRYVFLAGLAYVLCYYPGLRFLKRFKIQSRLAKKKQIQHELLFSLSTITIFSMIGLVVYFLFINGYTTLYTNIDQYGLGYLFLSLLLLIILHDGYFYWIHRLLHTRWFLRRIHVVHHKSTNPTPWTAYSFHPLEALIQSLIVFPFISIFPVHVFVLLFFTFIVILMNVIGHLGFEFLPKNWRNGIVGRYLISSTHHNLHHQKGKKNFGNYFTFWDKLMRTLQNEINAEKYLAKLPKKQDCKDSGIRPVNDNKPLQLCSVCGLCEKSCVNKNALNKQII